MKKIVFFALLIVFTLGIVAIPAAGYCQEIEKKSYKATGRPEAYIIDVLVARPIGILACAVGFGGLIVSAPFAAMSGTSEQAFDAFLTEPGEYTFTRPLGQFD